MRFKYLFIAVLALLLAMESVANSFSYIYIEGDKQTPFYVKLEGEMLPRLNKNYYLIPNLDAGYTRIEILFQQHKYPAQHFLIKVPPAGFRSFILHQTNEDKFELIDNYNNVKILPGNNEDNYENAVQNSDNLLLVDPVSASVSSNSTGTEKLPDFPTSKKAPKKNIQENQASSSSEMQFLDNVTLSGGAEAGAANTIAKPSPSKRAFRGDSDEAILALPHLKDDDFEDTISADELVEEEKQIKPEISSEATLVKSDVECEKSMSTNDFEDFAYQLLQFGDDDDGKIKFLQKNAQKHCFSTEYVRIIAGSLQTQSGRYAAVRLLQPQTSDKEHFAKLEGLFYTDYLKQKFRELLY